MDFNLFSFAEHWVHHQFGFDMSCLHVDSIIKSFGTRQVLTDIFLTCHTGEIVGLLGRNGSGKSTLLKIIFGSMRADSKFVRAGNKIINNLQDGRKRINYLPQDNFMPGHIKIATIVSMFCNEVDAKIIQQKEFIEPLLSRKCGTLSGGEKRLVEILIMIHSDASFILIDEPFNGVAPVYKEEIKKMIRAQSGTKGFIITDHDYRNILDISTKTLLIHDGGIREIKDIEALRNLGYISESRKS